MILLSLTKTKMTAQKVINRRRNWIYENCSSRTEANSIAPKTD